MQKFKRIRNLKKTLWIRDLLEEVKVFPQDLIMPIFLVEGKNIKQDIPSMPTINRVSIDLAIKKIKKLKNLGVKAVALFPVIDSKLKDTFGKEAINPNNLICKSVKEIKDNVPDIGIICDVALDPYTNHGHDGVLQNNVVDNDMTIDILANQALILSKAGSDIVAPSDMMDGRILKIRNILDDNKFKDVVILSYAAKFASAYYGPFREAIATKNSLGKLDKKTYQLNPANLNEALKKVEIDISEGADIIMVKPGTPYLDIISKVKEQFKIPVFAYQVSGEYSMIKFASNAGCFDLKTAALESLISLKRAGANAIFTYFAEELVEHLNG